MHAFGMSERYLILAEYPLRVNPLKLAFSGKPFIENYTWRADEPTRFQVFDRETGELRGTYETDAFFCFHHVNAFERGGELVVDLCAYEDSSIIDSLYLDEQRPARHAIPPRRAAPLHDRPRRRRRALRAARRRRAGAAADRLRPPQHARLLVRVLRAASDSGWIDRLVKVDVRDGSAVRVAAPTAATPASRSSCASRAADAEDAGVVLSVVLDANARPLVPAGAGRRLVRGAGPRRGAAPHPVRLPRPVLPMSELLASDADRDRVAERLRTAAGEGRLTPAELEERLEGAFSARTDAELEPLVADLPTSRPVRERHSTRRPDLGPFVLVSLMLVGIWALTGMGYFWPVWPIAGWGISFVAPGTLRGPCRRRSSSRGSSTARWRSSAAAGPGSGERPRSSWPRSARSVVVCGRRQEPLDETAARGRTAGASRRTPATSARRTRSRRSSTACSSATARSTCS